MIPSNELFSPYDISFPRQCGHCKKRSTCINFSSWKTPWVIKRQQKLNIQFIEYSRYNHWPAQLCLNTPTSPPSMLTSPGCFIPLFPGQRIHLNPNAVLWKPQSFPASPHVNLSLCHHTAASASSWTYGSVAVEWWEIFGLSCLDRPFFCMVPPTITHEKRKRLKPDIKDNLQGTNCSCSLWGEFTEYGQLDFVSQ